MKEKRVSRGNADKGSDTHMLKVANSSLLLKDSPHQAQGWMMHPSRVLQRDYPLAATDESEPAFGHLESVLNLWLLMRF